MIKKSAVLLSIFCLALAAAGAAAQDTYPTRPIRLVVGFAAGGSTDIPARYVADKLGTLLGQRVAVENKGGAAGMLATREVLAQPRDGYTLLLCTHFEPINTAVYRNPQFQLSDLAPISLISKYYYGFALANAVPATDIGSFVRYAKQHPGEISYGTVGTASAQEMFARQLERMTGIAMTKVPYRGGAPAMQDLLPGRIQLFISPMISVIPHAQQKQLKILGVSSPERLKAAPDVPTLREQGIDFVRFGWLGICAPAGTPKPIVDRLHREIAGIGNDPEFRRKRLIDIGIVPIFDTPEHFGHFIADQRGVAERLIRESGFQPR